MGSTGTGRDGNKTKSDKNKESYLYQTQGPGRMAQTPQAARVRATPPRRAEVNVIGVQ